MYIDIEDGNRVDIKYSASRIIGIRTQDWDRIKFSTNLFNSKGIVPNHWQKVVEIELKNPPGKCSTTIEITTDQYKKRRTVSFSFHNQEIYPNPSVENAVRFLQFLFESSDFFTLEFPPSSDNNSNSNSGSLKKTNKKNDLHDLFYDDKVGDRTRLNLVSDFLSHKISLDSSHSREFVSSFKTTAENHTHATYIRFANALHSNNNSNNNEHDEYHNIASRIPPTTIDAILKSHETTLGDSDTACEHFARCL